MTDNRKVFGRRRFHIHASVDNLLAEDDSYLQEIAPTFKCDGCPCQTAAQVRAALEEAKADGWAIIPAEGCDNYDKKTGCLGHIIQEEKEE